MKVCRFSKNKLVVKCSDIHELQNVQSICDGRKVRNKNQTIIPIGSIGKLRMFDMVEYLDDTAEVLKHHINSVGTRERNVIKIKGQDMDNVRFDYDYKGVYSHIMGHQKMLFNLIVYTNGAALLADPGLGKTGPSLWGIDHKMTQGKVVRTMYITLSSLKDNVHSEIKTELPHRTSVVLKGSAHADKVLNKKYKRDVLNKDYDIYIASYESMNNLSELFSDDFFDMVILDEVQRIGNPSSNQTKAIVRKFENAKFKYILTGTLNANNLMSFFMPYRFMGADFVPYANYYRYRKEYMTTVDPDERIWVNRAGAVAATADVIAKSAITFKVEECLDMPPVSYNKVFCSMAPDQEKAYKSAVEDMVIEIKSVCNKCEDSDTCELKYARDNSLDTKGLGCVNSSATIDSAVILARKIHQIASGFFIDSWVEVDDAGKETKHQEVHNFKTNPKKKIILDTIDSIPSDEKVLIFGIYTSFLESIYNDLVKKYGHKSVIRCWGSDDAFKAVEEFKKPGKRFLIGNQTKLGTGLNIQFSRYQLYTMNSFSFVQREQAIGRQWRKGQSGKVMVYDFFTRDSVDDHIYDTLLAKKSLSMSLEAWSKITQRKAGAK